MPENKNNSIALTLCRVLPAVFMTMLSLLGLIIVVGAPIFVAYHEIDARWINPDLDALFYLHEKALPPPLIAAYLCILIGTYCGLKSAIAWARGFWARAIKYTIAFFIFAAICRYVANGG